MTTLNISLPESMRAFIEEEIAKGGYSTASEYIRHLIRQAQKTATKERLDMLLLEGLESGESVEVIDQWWDEKRDYLLNKLRQQQSQ